MRIPAEVKFTSWAIFRLVYTANISRGGMKIDLPIEPRVGDLLMVKLVPPKGEPVLLDATVRHVAVGSTGAQGRLWTAGVEFRNLTAEARARIEALLAAHRLDS